MMIKLEVVVLKIKFLGLWLNGIPNIGIHPYLLHYNIVVYNNLGVNPYILSPLLTK